MKLRTTLLLFAFLVLSPSFAQEDAMITTEPMTIPESDRDANDPFVLVEVMPEFPGGQTALFSYISKELKYPEQAVEENIEGVVYITFVVERDGSINDVKVLRGIGGGCSEEAVRVVERMPNWSPGTQAGKAVRVQSNLPIRFKLTEPTKPKE